MRTKLPNNLQEKTLFRFFYYYYLFLNNRPSNKIIITNTAPIGGGGVFEIVLLLLFVQKIRHTKFQEKCHSDVRSMFVCMRGNDPIKTRRKCNLSKIQKELRISAKIMIPKRRQTGVCLCVPVKNFAISLKKKLLFVIN